MLRTTLAVILGLAASASADTTVYQGRFGLHYTRVPQALGVTPAATADTHILFMNKCTGGCTVTPGTPDNRTDHSDIPQSTGHLSQFSQSATVWNQVMSCMRDTFSRFNVTITDVDPGQTAHMEVMVAGLGSQLGQPQGVLGIADFPCTAVGQCDSFMPNALVFAFANDPYYTNNPDEICSTAAQEIAHTWALDHVVDPSDPMTYNSYTGIRQYKDNQKCGSDCQGGQSPFGLACAGSGGNATHTCTGTGQATQDEVTLITQLFGSSTPDTTPPTVAITSPANNASVMPGFAVTATVSDDNAVASAELKLDGTSLGVKTAAPYSWAAPQSLTAGSHHLVVIGTDAAGNTGMAAIDVAYGSPCMHDSDCTDTKDICDNGHCVPGPSTPGGLGATCVGNADCASMQCADDGAGHKYCVEGCNPAMSACPSGFSCETVSPGAGVCWPGANNGGGGGCNTGGERGAGMLLLGLGVVLIVRRRRG